MAPTTSVLSIVLLLTLALFVFGCGDDFIHPLDVRYVSDEEAYTRQGWNEYAAGDPRQATATFERALAYNPDFPGAHAGLGWIALDQHDIPSAQECFTTALSSDPEDVRALIGMANVHWVLGEFQACVDAGEAALLQMDAGQPPESLNIERSDVLLLLAQTLYALGQYEPSLEYLLLVAPQPLFPESPTFIEDLLQAIEEAQAEDAQVQEAIR